MDTAGDGSVHEKTTRKTIFSPRSIVAFSNYSDVLPCSLWSHEVSQLNAFKPKLTWNLVAADYKVECPILYCQPFQASAKNQFTDLVGEVKSARERKDVSQGV